MTLDSFPVIPDIFYGHPSPSPSFPTFFIGNPGPRPFQMDPR